jgi:mannose-6-phosphate isomerase-like protein (cupin superfamily)
MLGWNADIEQLTLENTNFRTVVYTGKHAQLTLMSLKPGEDIGWERHGHIDQFLRLEQGTARLDLGSDEENVDESHEIGADWALIVPAGTWHNVTNTGKEPVKLYSIYSPPEHADGTIHVTRQDDPHH